MNGCNACGMHVTARAFHPFIACLAFRAAQDGNQVEGNLRFVVAYGMRAERAGVSLDRAMADLSAVPGTVEAADESAAARIADLEAQLAEFDAAPVTDARIWDGVRDAIHEKLAVYFGSTVAKSHADELTRIALGERVEADHG